jgi:peptidoglycan hydrolase CwlO-like protein
MITREQLEARLAQLEAEQKTVMENIDKLQAGIDQFRANVSAYQGGIEICKELIASLSDSQ